MALVKERIGEGKEKQPMLDLSHYMWERLPANKNEEDGARFAEKFAKLAESCAKNGINPANLFQDGLPAVAPLIASEERLGKLIELGIACAESRIDPTGAFKHGLGEIAHLITSEERFCAAIDMCKTCAKGKVDPLYLLTTISQLHQKGFSPDDLFGKHGRMIAGFYARSGRRAGANSIFFDRVTPENFRLEMRRVNLFFEHLHSNAFLPRLYEWYSSLPPEKRSPRSEPLASAIRYMEELAEGGQPEKPKELPEEAICELDLMVINSTILSKGEYVETIERMGRFDIPEPNFTTRASFVITRGEIKGSLPPDDLEFVRERIEFIRRAVGTPKEWHLAHLFSSKYKEFLVEKPPSDRYPELSGLCERLAGNEAVKGLLSAPPGKVDVFKLKEALVSALEWERFDSGKLFSELGDLLSEAEEGERFTRKKARFAMPFLIFSTAEREPHIMEAVKALLSSSLSPGKEQLEAIRLLQEIFAELKPTASQDVRKELEAEAGVPRLKKLERHFKHGRRRKAEVWLIPAKNRIDFFYGYMGENCTRKKPEELLNSRFTPMRIVCDGAIEGCVHTLTLEMDGKKCLVIPGIEPKETFIAGFDAGEFVNRVMDALVEICKQNGYDMLLFTTTGNTQSNRPEVRDAIARMIEGKPDVANDVQPKFPKGTDYGIERLKVVWAKDESTLF